MGTTKLRIKDSLSATLKSVLRLINKHDKIIDELETSTGSGEVIEILKPGGELGDNGNWRFIMDESSILYLEKKIAGTWTEQSSFNLT